MPNLRKESERIAHTSRCSRCASARPTLILCNKNENLKWIFLPIINQVIGALWYLIPIAVLVLVIILKSPWFKGVTGEFIVNVAARMFLNKHVYHLIKNVTLRTEDGTTQIDHIIVSRYGVFVVETKNMKGWIFGNPNEKTWTQKIYKHSSKFQNPLAPKLQARKST